MIMIIEKNKVVSIDYTLTLEDGKILDSSDGREPLTFIHGLGHIIPGLENALEGKITGDAFAVKIEPESAYGEYKDDLVQSIPRTYFEPGVEITPGMQFSSEESDGYVTVIEVHNDKIVVDGNHPLAGLVLNFDVKVTSIRNASDEELEHGHVHGEGCHHHH